ncbi:MAG TPA: MASE1 domain-containing protein [Aestuariivirgaceae bacterium]|nr:MASE1 domain-containing protein [Aestuariivirgaceae bacterium]
MSLDCQRLPFFLRRLAGKGHARVRLAIGLVCFSLAYFLAAKLGIATSLPPQGIVILWPPNAIVLVTLLAVRREHWWMFFAVTVATEIAAAFPAYPLWASAGYGIVNFSEGAIAAALLSAFVRDPSRLAGTRDFVTFVVVGPLLAAGTAAVFGALIYKIGAPEVDYLHYWRVFWQGDALGLLIIGTSLLAWRRADASLTRTEPYAAAEAVVLALGLPIVALWALTADPDTPRVYLVFPLLLWAALRFGVRGAALAVPVTVAIAIGAAISGHGPFVGISGIDTVVSLQGLIGVIALSTFLLAFTTEDLVRTGEDLSRSVHEHRAAEEKLARINRDLDRMVADRTGRLQKTLARNETLLREVHHRVKNNLQFVASLLGLHSRGASEAAVRDKLAEVQRQVAAIASTYDVLQQMESVETVDLCQVVPALCRSIDGATGDLVTLAVRTSGEAMVSADAAVALSLALNELVTNSIKHAGGDRPATVAVGCRRSGANVLVSVSDDGPGFPPDFDVGQPKGFGIRMAQDLVERAGGRLRIARADGGAIAEISVPVAA